MKKEKTKIWERNGGV